MPQLDDYINKDGDPLITDTTRSILTQYSKIPETELIGHIRGIRDKAWEVFNYPCIGSYNFLDFSIRDHAIYEEVVRRVKEGATLIDLGCCFGQDIRKLIVDGCPAENLLGTELEPAFINFGYDLFRDRESLQASTFKTGDFFDSETPYNLPEQSFDFMHSASFFHLFTWDEQLDAFSRGIRLLKRKPGCLIFGRQAIRDVAGPFEELKVRSGPMFMHNEESFRKFLGDVSMKTGVQFDIDIRVLDKVGQRAMGVWQDLHFVLRTV
ncbi:uncharacterized protein RCC_12308 [Ramularia collo-cygni]|uniref:Methyltransferase domain-containing protein n=1 Tax=Ramularia collo-cygni TaxID=112498 RepID=A0A2D3ULN3_9PEZI|nr:uncharacterized protein RCC_12308 [Ramularia collo-cygni]CZT15202.1 uncharacterized protein RCC_12308 [Ramularia collo-cygni]